MLDIREAADRLGVHYSTVYRWSQSGKLIPERRGRKHFFTEEELQRFVQEEAQDDCHWWAREGDKRGPYKKKK